MTGRKTKKDKGSSRPYVLPEGMTRYTLYLDEPLKIILQRLADENDISVNELILIMIEDALRKLATGDEVLWEEEV